jgi:hypothetical protein
MDSDADTSFMLLRMLGPATTFFGFFISSIVMSPIVLYVMARWRSHREPAPDTQLGLKFALHYFAMLATQLVLAAIALALYAVLSGTPTESKGTALRLAFGLLLPSAVVLGIQIGALRFTNDALVPGVRRLFIGYNMLTTGIVAFGGLIMGCEVVLAKDGGDGLGYVAAAIGLVYCGAWLGLAWLFGSLVLGGRSAGSPPASAVVLATTLPEPQPLHRD